jgi:hypothetical protein
MRTASGGRVYPDVVGAQMLLRYDTVDAGCCRVLLHPRWQSRCYPSTLFTTADPATVCRLLGLGPPSDPNGAAAAELTETEPDST